MKKTALLTLALCLAGTATGAARPRLDIEISHQAPARIPIGLELPAEMDEFSRVLARDLEWSGYFAPRPAAADDETAPELRLACHAEEDGVRARLVSGDSPVFHRRFTSRTREERLLAHTVAAAVIEEVTGQPAITLSRIVAARQVGDEKEIVLLDYDGGRRRPLTRDASLNRYPRFSPDGRSILYTSFLRYWPAVYHQELATGRRRVVSAQPGLNTAAVFHPDGEQIALSLSRDGNPGELYLMDLEGGDLQRLTRSPSSDTAPAFLPDGKGLVFVSDRTGRPHIYHYDLADGSIRRLSFDSHYNTSPAVSPDGRFLAYTASIGGQLEIRLLELSSGRSYQLTDGPGRKEDPAFAPNSRHLVYVHTTGRSSNLRLLDIFTREEYRITSDGGYATPDWR